MQIQQLRTTSDLRDPHLFNGLGEQDLAVFREVVLSSLDLHTAVKFFKPQKK